MDKVIIQIFFMLSFFGFCAAEHPLVETLANETLKGQNTFFIGMEKGVTSICCYDGGSKLAGQHMFQNHFPGVQAFYIYDRQGNLTSVLREENRQVFGGFFSGIAFGTLNFFDQMNNLSLVVSDTVNSLSLIDWLKGPQKPLAEELFGKDFLMMNGYYEEAIDVGCFGKVEISGKVRVTAINGLLNVKENLISTVSWLSETHGDVLIHYVFRPTNGWTQDLFKGLMIKSGFVSTPAKYLAALWRRLIYEMGGVGGGGMIVHYAHSIGGTDTAAAKELLLPEEQQMIRVITIGSATIIPDSGFASVLNYVSRRDGIVLIDPVGYIQGLIDEDSNLMHVGNHLGVPLIDHFLSQETYKSLIEMLGARFLSEFVEI